jgi:hypothetical protein
MMKGEEETNFRRLVIVGEMIEGQGDLGLKKEENIVK